jgi:hypothetical protein
VLPEFKADGVPLTKIIDRLRVVSGANLFVHWRALEAVGIDRKVPLTLDLSHLRLSEALDKLLLKAAGEEGAKLGYTIVEGVIVISSDEDLKAYGDPVLW